MRRPLQRILLLTFAAATILSPRTLPAVAQSPQVQATKPHPEVQALLDKGKQAADAEKWDESMGWNSKALEQSRSLKDVAGEAAAFIGISRTYSGTGEYQKSIAALQQSLPLFRKTGDKKREANALFLIGNSYYSIFTGSLGQPTKALGFYLEALSQFRTVGDDKYEAISLSCIGDAYSDTGHHKKALEVYQQALLKYKSAGHKKYEANTLDAIGRVYDSIGQYQKALEFYQAALLMYESAGDRKGEANILAGVGSTYFNTGQLSKALDFFQRANFLYRTTGNKDGEASTLANIAIVYSETGERQKALGSLLGALPMFRELGNKPGEATTLGAIGGIYFASGNNPMALDYYQRALQMYRTAGIRHAEADALANIGATHYFMNQTRAALSNYQQSLQIQEAIGDKAGQANTLSYMAVVQEGLGHSAQAGKHLSIAIRLLDSMRDSLGGLSEAKQAIHASSLHTYHQYIALLLKQGKTPLAFEITQRTKARAILDLLYVGKVQATTRLNEEERARHQELRRIVNQINQRIIGETVKNAVGSKEGVRALKQQLANAEINLQTYSDRLYARHPELARMRAATTVTHEDLLRILPPDSAVLDYVSMLYDTGQHKSERNVLFVVTNRDGNPTVNAFTIPVTRSVLAEHADDLRTACGNANSSYQSKASDLYKVLIGPAAKQIAGKKRLIICPDGPLWDVPFQALIDKDGKFLFEKYEITYAYSATGAQAALDAGARRRKTPAPGILMAMANPDFGDEKRFGGAPVAAEVPTDNRAIETLSRDAAIPRGGKVSALPGTQREADALQLDFPQAAIYTGKEAQESTVKREAGKYRYLHFATHGFFNDTAPLMSSIVLAQPQDDKEDGFLTAREIFDMDLKADMVVLSACNTARGEKRSGEGVIGLTWALFAAGAPTQVVSQWSVDDASTASLMERFYAGIKRGEAKGSALRTSALSLMKDGQHRHPFYWAPFILMGDWR